jgi:hypothetical protein
MLALATMLLAGTATAASACGSQASLKTGVTAATAQDLSAASKMKMTKDEMGAKKSMKKGMTTGGPATKSPAGTGSTPDPKSSSTGNAGTGAGAAGGAAAGEATNSGK